MYGDKLYGAGRARDRRHRLLKKLGVPRETIEARISHGKDNFGTPPENATKEQMKVHTRILQAQKGAVKNLEETLAQIQEYETEVTRYGYQLQDDFNGKWTESVLIPLPEAPPEAVAVADPVEAES